MTLSDLAPVANHLWQSTVFVGVVWLLSLMLRSNRAAVRYWLWLAGSVKFLIPFAMLIAIGGVIEWRSAPAVSQPQVTYIIDTFSQPFAGPGVNVAQRLEQSRLWALMPVALLILWVTGSAMHVLAWWVSWRRLATIVRRAPALPPGRELETLRRLERAMAMRQPIQAVLSDAAIEPGILGIRRPVLLWPQGIGERLSDRQLEALLTHELCHIRRRDNLTAAVHMVIEALFWFHPLVWWLEKRLVDERERVCDETVIRSGSDPQEYAEGILKTCEFYAESPLACVSGVTGSDLKRRVEAIMTGHVGVPVSPVQRLALLIGGAATVAVPLISGATGASSLAAQAPSPPSARATFDVVSIKPNKSGDDRVISSTVPNRYTSINMTPQMLILLAYQLQTSQLTGGPAWISSYRFDIEAKSERAFSPQELFPMLQNVLAVDFGLTFHYETRPIPAYSLVLTSTKTTGRLKPGSTATCASGQQPRRGPQNPDALLACGAVQTFPGHYTARSVPMIRLVNYLAGRVNRVVVDHTGLEGLWDVELDYTPDRIPPGALGNGTDVDLNAPSLFTALQEQLGLKLESTRSPVDVMAIDSIKRPTDDAALVDSPAPAGPVANQPTSAGNTVDANRRVITTQLNELQASMKRAVAEPAASETQSSPQQQSAAPSGPAFEVASIKPNKSGETGNVFRLAPSGGFAATNAPLKELIRVAYQLQGFQIAGAPNWTDSARFDIDAKPEGGALAIPTAGVAPQMLMLRALLADRFNLRVHNESRDLPIYTLILARADGKFGPMLRPTEGGCRALVAERAGGGPSPATATSSRCGMRRMAGAITGRDITMAQLANGLAPLVGRLVTDRTGLSANVDLDLSWMPEPIASSSAAIPPATQTDSGGPSIFTALQEQLGLRLEATRGPVEVLVIDGVEQPSPD